MKRHLIGEKRILDEAKQAYELRYFLSVHSGEWGQVYGVQIEMRDAQGVLTQDRIGGLSEEREEAEAFARRICAAAATPAELAALADDFVSEREGAEERCPALSAS